MTSKYVICVIKFGLRLKFLIEIDQQATMALKYVGILWWKN